MNLIQTILDNYAYNPTTGLFTWIKGGKKFGTPAFTTFDVYYQANVGGQKVYAHRAAFVCMGFEMPEMVDHKDRNKKNNRWGNLRAATRSLNALNTDLRIDNSTGYAGVSLHSSGKYVATLQGQYIGLFKTAEAASQARNPYGKKG